MKNSFCRICLGRFNLKFSPAAVDSKNKKPSSRTIAIRIESGEISENICWDCDDTLLGFHKSVGEDNEDEEEPVIVDDDEILYKSLEKTRHIHRLPQKFEVIEIDSSDSEHEERVTVPRKDEFIDVESASTVFGISRNNYNGVGNSNQIVIKKEPLTTMNGSTLNNKMINYTKNKVFESMKCPVCPYLSGVECEVVTHIRQTHPHYKSDIFRFDYHSEDNRDLTRRIIFVHLYTFFECKVCGKIHDRIVTHRKHLDAMHNRQKTQTYHQNGFNNHVVVTNDKVFNSHCTVNIVQNPKRALDFAAKDRPPSKVRKIDEHVLRLAATESNTVKASKSAAAPKARKVNKTIKKNAEKKPPAPPTNKGENKKSKSQALVRKQQLLQARRERRRLKRAEEKMAAQIKSKSKLPPVIPKPTFKMPQQPAPRVSSVIKQSLQKQHFTCKLCLLTLTGFIRWNMHMLRVHPEAELHSRHENDDSVQTQCRKCDKNFTSASNLRTHDRLSHRRKNRLVEINGNDNEEYCRQTLTPKIDPKESQQQQPEPSGSVSPNEELKAAELEPHISGEASLCEYCGLLFDSLDSLHESNHIENGDVKRIFLAKPQA